jgi:hypothetical protein
MSDSTILMVAIGTGVIGILLVIGGAVFWYSISRTRKPRPENRRRSRSLVIPLVLLICMVALLTLASAGIGVWWLVIGRGGIQNSPESVAQRFLKGEMQSNDLAPDGRYEAADYKGYGSDPLAWVVGDSRGSSIDPFNYTWAVQSDSRTDYELEIQDVIVRDSLRPNSKEVTVIYTERYNEIQPPWCEKPLGEVTSEDMQPVPPEQWHLTGKHVVRESQAAFFIMEQLNDRWVVWCAEIEPSVIFLPDLCEY